MIGDCCMVGSHDYGKETTTMMLMMTTTELETNRAGLVTRVAGEKRKLRASKRAW
jgi:hypothetical protein